MAFPGAEVDLDHIRIEPSRDRVQPFYRNKDQKSDRWRLEKEGSNRAKRTFDTKEDALKNLRGAVGPHGGSVRIRKVDNTIQEERTYPRSKDPKRSPG